MNKTYGLVTLALFLILTGCSSMNVSNHESISRGPSSVGTPKVLLPMGEYFYPGGQGFWSDGNGDYCDVPEWSNYDLKKPGYLYKGTNLISTNPVGFNRMTDIQKKCKIIFPKGNYHLPEGVNFYSYGTGTYCTYANWNDFLLSGGNSNIDQVTHISSLPNNLGTFTPCLPILSKGRYQLPNKNLFSSDGKGGYCTYSNLDAFVFLGGDPKLKNVTQITDPPTGADLKNACVIPPVSISPTSWTLYDDQAGKADPCTPTMDGPVIPTSYRDGGNVGFHFTIVGLEQGKNANYWVNGSVNSTGTGIVSWPKVSCKSIFTSAYNPNFNAFDGSEWLVGTYATSTGLYAMFHSEYYGGNWGHHLPQDARCPSGSPFVCWYSSVGGAKWNTATQTFQRQGSSPNFVTAKSSLPFSPTHAVGYWTNTNIVKNNDDGYYYMYLTLIPSGAIYCPSRTKDLSNPASWRAWDGQDYTVDVHTGGDCTGTNSPLLPIYIGYNTYLKKYISVGYISVGTTKNFLGYTTSDDLVHWSNPVSFGIQSVINREPVNVYSSLIDFQALAQVGNLNAMNGAQTGKNPNLVYVHFAPNGDRTVVVKPIVFNPTN